MPTIDDAWQTLGDAGVHALVDTFYDAMDQLPEAAALRAMHPEDLGESRRRLALFLIGRFGGADDYVRERGHPRLRARHAPFPIDPDAAGQWLLCMRVALDHHVADAALRALLWDFFVQVAAHMVNRPPAA